MCSSRKNPYPPHGRSLEIPRGRGILKVKILEAKYEAKLEFTGGGGGGCKTKNLLREEYGYLLDLHNQTHFLFGLSGVIEGLCLVFEKNKAKSKQKKRKTDNLEGKTQSDVL